jgi:lysophospholipase L1-like esterase
MGRALVIAAVVTAVFASSASAATKGRSLLVVGDSLAVGTQPYLSHYLPGWHVTTSASISRHAPEGAGVMKRYGKGLPRVIFVNLGTNDSPGAIGQFTGALRRVMEVAGPSRCVVWADIVRPPVGGVSYSGLNHALSVQAAKRRNLIKFKWKKLAGRHRGWFGPDGVHPTATGYQVRAKAMAHNIRVCRKLTLRG